MQVPFQPVAPARQGDDVRAAPLTMVKGEAAGKRIPPVTHPGEGLATRITDKPKFLVRLGPQGPKTVVAVHGSWYAPLHLPWIQVWAFEDIQ